MWGKWLLWIWLTVCFWIHPWPSSNCLDHRKCVRERLGNKNGRSCVIYISLLQYLFFKWNKLVCFYSSSSVGYLNLLIFWWLSTLLYGLYSNQGALAIGKIGVKILWPSVHHRLFWDAHCLRPHLPLGSGWLCALGRKTSKWSGLKPLSSPFSGVLLPFGYRWEGCTIPISEEPVITDFFLT